MASIEKRGSSFRVVWRHNSAKQSTTWPNERLAWQARRLVEGREHRVTPDEVYEIVGGVEIAPRRQSVLTFRTWSEMWMAALVRPGDSTRANYQAQLDRQILPAIGELALVDVDAIAVATLVNSLKVKFANTTVTRYYAVLFQCLNFAVKMGKIPVNPCYQINFRRDEPDQLDTSDEDDDHVYLTLQEYEQILSNIHPADRPLVEFLAGTGCRISEATAVTVSAIRLHGIGPQDPAPVVRIQQTHKGDGSGGRRVLGIPKGRRRRWVSLGQRVLEAIAPVHTDRNPTEFLFTATRGGPINADNWRNRVWDKAVGEARRCPQHPPALPPQPVRGPRRQWTPDEVSTCNCPGVLSRRPTPHDLRHSHACWLLSEGHDLLFVSRRLGHASVSLTERVYGGITRQRDNEAATLIDRAMGAGTRQRRLLSSV